MYVKSRKAEQSEHTRRLLLDVARALFAERGYAGTATEEIVARAGVTRGALYHHFRNKQDLFRGVVVDMEEQALEKLKGLVTAVPDPWDRLRAGVQGFLDSCMDPAVQRIMLTDAPSVLGPGVWREFGAGYHQHLSVMLNVAMDAGILERQPTEPLAHLLLGALGEAAMLIARAEDVPATRATVGASVDRLLRGLRTDGR